MMTMHNAISNKKRILQIYAQENGFINRRFFVDDGWSGANFDGPGFLEIIYSTENGVVKCVITKDLATWDAMTDKQDRLEWYIFMETRKGIAVSYSPAEIAS